MPRRPSGTARDNARGRSSRRTVPSRSTRRTRPAGCRPARWTASSSRGHSPTHLSDQRPTAQNDASSTAREPHLGLVPDYGEDAGLALDDTLGRLQTHLAPRLVGRVHASRRGPGCPSSGAGSTGPEPPAARVQSPGGTRPGSAPSRAGRGTLSYARDAGSPTAMER